MRKIFSEYYGFQKSRDTFQLYSIDAKLQNRIWNQIKRYCLDEMQIDFRGNIELKCDREFILEIYDKFFKAQINIVDIHDRDNRIIFDKFNKDFEKRFFTINREKAWYKIYDLIQIIYEICKTEDLAKKFHKNINQILEAEMSGYRLVNNYIAPIIDDVEIQEIEDALDCEYSGVKRHLSNALEFLSNRENPDYQNSIKESISAVESIVNKVSGKTNVALNRCFQYIPFEMDKNFNSAMIKLYSWTSSVDGIRHGSTEEEIKSSFAEAKYMLVTCSAFVNYLIEKKG